MSRSGVPLGEFLEKLMNEGVDALLAQDKQILMFRKLLADYIAQLIPRNKLFMTESYDRTRNTFLSLRARSSEIAQSLQMLSDPMQVETNQLIQDYFQTTQHASDALIRKIRIMRMTTIRALDLPYDDLHQNAPSSVETFDNDDFFPPLTKAAPQLKPSSQQNELLKKLHAKCRSKK